MKPIKPSISNGIFHMLIAAASFAAMTAFVKFSSETLPPFEIVFARSLLGSLMMGALMWKEKISFLGTYRKMLILRGVFGFTALVMNFYTISKLNLGTAVILNNTSPIFVAILAALLLKEKISARLWGLTSLCFAGVYFLSGPQFLAKPFPIVTGILSGVMAALAFVTISTAKRNESSYTIIFYFTAISTLGSLPLLGFGFVLPDLRGWLGIAGIAVFSFFGQVFITRSVREAPASVVCPFSYLSAVFSFLFGCLIWKDRFTAGMILGAVLIIASGVLIYILERQPEPLAD